MLVSTAQDPGLIIMLCVLQDNDLSEFDESREIVQNLVDEYKACESADYIKWGMEVSCACCASQDFGDSESGWILWTERTLDLYVDYQKNLYCHESV
jgi:hypothetical protein